jgi:hypothetical protein
MKKIIEDLSVRYTCSTAYAGSTRIMYIKGERAKKFIKDVREKYPKLAFELKAVSDLPTFQLFSGTEVSTELVENIVNDAYETVFPKEKIEQLTQLPLDEKQTFDREALDAYLVNNPIDKSIKGCYLPAAELFEVTSEYVRGRYRKLKEKGKIVEPVIA